MTTLPLLVIGSAPHSDSGFLIRHTAGNRPVVLLGDRLPPRHESCVTGHRLADLGDSRAVAAAADALAGSRGLSGILAWEERHLMAAALLAERRGLPGNSPDAVAAIRDKAASRQRFAAAGVPSAAFTWVHSLDAAASAAERIGYPAVLKPAVGTGAAGVVRTDAVTGLPRAWTIASHAALLQGPDADGVLFEEFLDGPDVSVATVTRRGATTAVALTRTTCGLDPYFLPTRHTVTAEDPLLGELAPLAAAAVRALGITDGISHVDLRLTSNGPRVIDVNAHPGDGLTIELIHRATGVDLPRAAAAIACGQAPDLQPTRHRTAAAGVIHPPGDGTVTRRELLPGDDTHLAQFRWLCAVGDHITRTPPGDRPARIRAGLAIVTADTPDRAHHHLAGVLARAAIDVRTTAPRSA
ncbi:ATP-grasp domain-containing protein [Streptomyces sp. NPDC001889]